MTTFDPFNAIIAKPENPLPHAENGPLVGERLAVKDIYDLTGMVTGCGNPQILAESVPAEKSAPVVEKLLAAGAEVIGKAQTDELAFSLMGQNSHYPHPINPAAPDRVTGGSSSGSAAAVAAGIADIALGSDTGGSIRAPASFCGLVGLRTTHGRIPLEGIMPLAPSLDTIGWFARDIALYEKVGAVLLGEDSQSFQLTQLLYMPVLEQLLLGQDETDAYRAMFGAIRPHFSGLKAASQPTLSIDELYLAFRQIQGPKHGRPTAHGYRPASVSSDRALPTASFSDRRSRLTHWRNSGHGGRVSRRSLRRSSAIMPCSHSPPFRALHRWPTCHLKICRPIGNRPCVCSVFRCSQACHRSHYRWVTLTARPSAFLSSDHVPAIGR